ncbi:nucleoside triphosphate pyrophosphohydrolase [Halomonadaceae bacterium KBTZ08]
MSRTYSMDDLLTLMARLRDPEQGCPWDLEQDFRTIVPHTIEETYEVADAIERGAFDHLPDELGDLLFQVVFYAQLAREEGRFSFSDLVDGVTRKMIRRHPHIFPDGTLDSHPGDANGMTEADVRVNWERIKAEEKQEQGAPEKPGSALDDVTPGLPAFQRAAKLQKRASKVGFDWPETGMVFDKLHEEADELKAAWRNQSGPEDRDQAEDELGDLLFAVVNLSRFLGVDAEQALRRANHKFERRFRCMEKQLQAEGEGLEGRDIEALEAAWRQAKKASDAET